MDQALCIGQSQPPGYQRTAAWRVISPRRDATRRTRFATLVADSAAGVVTPGGGPR